MQGENEFENSNARTSWGVHRGFENERKKKKKEEEEGRRRKTT
jgi:hypothetical protein